MNFGITAAKYTAAFENLTGETFEDSQVFKLNKEATVDVIDYLDGQDNLDDMQKALKLQDKASSEIAIFVENTQELEAIVLENEKKILDGSATPQDVVNANEALTTACALFGFDKPVTAGFEAIGNDPVESLKIANEGLGDTISKGFTAVIDWFKKFFAGIWKFIKGLFGSTEEKVATTVENVAKTEEALKEANANKQKINSEIKSRVKYKEGRVKGKKKSSGNEDLSISNESNIEEEISVKLDDVLTSIKKIGVFLFDKNQSLDGVLNNMNKLKHVPEMSKGMIAEVEGTIATMKKQYDQVITEAKTMSPEEILTKMVSENREIASGEDLVKYFNDQLKGNTDGLIDDSYSDMRSISNELREMKNTFVQVLPDMKTTLGRMFSSNNVEQTHIFFKVAVVTMSIKNDKLSTHAKVFSPAAVINYNGNVTQKDFDEVINKGVDFVTKFQGELKSIIGAINPSVVKGIQADVEKTNKLIEQFVLDLEKQLTNSEINDKIDLGSYLRTNHLAIGLISPVTSLMPLCVDILLGASTNMLAYTNQLVKLK